MERLKERVRLARKALTTLSQALAEPKTAMNRDASIQRFEYSYEAVWKAAQAYLISVENLETGSPTAVARASFRVGLLTEEQSRAVLRMATDRNLTVHAYNEEIAEQIYSRLAAHTAVTGSWLDAMAGALRGPAAP